MLALANDREAFRKAIDEVSRQIVAADHREGLSYLKTPLLFPSGSSIVVRIVDAFPDFLVSDHGAGYDEAELMGASGSYARYARAVAESAGIGFDQHAFFVTKATRQQLAGAVVTVANCALEAATIAAYKLSERRQSDQAEALYRRLVSVFPNRPVAKDVSIRGQSNTEWHVALMVQSDGKRTLFEPVSNHHTSVFAASTKFHDIAAAEDAPGRVAVVRNKADLKTYLAVLSQAADVIERNAPDRTLIRLVA